MEDAENHCQEEFIETVHVEVNWTEHKEPLQQHSQDFLCQESKARTTDGRDSMMCSLDKNNGTQAVS